MTARTPAVGLAVAVALAFAAVGANAQQTQQPAAAPPATGSAEIPAMPPTAQAKAMIAEKFKAADTNHDGKLTRDEAKAGMPEVYKHFDEIDVKKKGYVTARQIGAYWQAKTKKQMQQDNPIWN